MYTVEYYSAIKKNEIMSFAATWMDLEIIILSEVSQTKISYDIAYIWHLKYDTDEHICETDSQTWRTDLWLPSRGWGRDGVGVWG